MRAIVIREPGGPDVLELRDVPSPEPSRGEVRVRVHATAVNRADLLQRAGAYPAPPGSPTDIPGLELAGEVDALGQGVTELALGDRVYGLVGGGAYAEQVVAHARTLARMPRAMTFTDAAAVPEAFLTAWDAMVNQARLGGGETVLVHAAASGVGTAALQIARAIGARPLGTARTGAKLARLAELRELDEGDGLVVSDGTFADRVLARTAGRGVDVVLELVGGAYVAQDLACVAHRGRIVVVGTMGGAAANLPLPLLMQKRIELRGTMLRSRPLEDKILVARVLATRITPLLERGALRPMVDRVLPLSQAADAHRVMHGNDTIGKVVLSL